MPCFSGMEGEAGGKGGWEGWWAEGKGIGDAEKAGQEAGTGRGWAAARKMPPENLIQSLPAWQRL